LLAILHGWAGIESLVSMPAPCRARRRSWKLGWLRTSRLWRRIGSPSCAVWLSRLNCDDWARPVEAVHRVVCW